jgi:transposase-like protein
MTGKFKGQLASASAVDGHNWLYPVALGVFDSITNDNWIWFMSQLREAIGSPRGLAICTDAGQAVMVGVAEVFPQAEHRECMFHLGRYLMNIFGLQHTRGTSIYLRNIRQQWRRLGQPQQII